MPYIFKKLPDAPEIRPYCTPDVKAVVVRLDHTDQCLSDMCEAFEDFLKGCGFIFDGHITIEKEEGDYEDTSGDDEGAYNSNVLHSESGEESNS